MASLTHQASTMPNSATERNTAPVMEFRCLYTHDMRRKSKRWQDGFLRYHTFNKRVMVYDVPRNFVGDLHWQESGLLQDGDELTLDAGVLVQVGEAVGSAETDLTPLLRRRTRKVPERVPGEMASSSPSSGPPQLRHKSLNALLGARKGPQGKAVVPVTSPFETRMAGRVEKQDAKRGPKRQKVNEGGHSGHDQSPGRTHNPYVPVPKPPERGTERVGKASGGPCTENPRRPIEPGGNASKDATLISSDSEDAFSDNAMREAFPGTKARRSETQIQAEAVQFITAPAPKANAERHQKIDPKLPSKAISQTGPQSLGQTRQQQDIPQKTLRIATGQPRKMLFLQDRRKDELSAPRNPETSASDKRRHDDLSEPRPATPRAAPTVPDEESRKSKRTNVKDRTSRSESADVNDQELIAPQAAMNKPDKVTRNSKRPEDAEAIQTIPTLPENPSTTHHAPPARPPAPPTNLPSAKPLPPVPSKPNPANAPRPKHPTTKPPQKGPTTVLRAPAKEKQKQTVLPAPVEDVDVGPWSSEALDFFDWRPPDWQERVKKGLVVAA